MTKSILLVLFASFSVSLGMDPDVQRAFDDALKVYPPGDYKGVPQIHSGDVRFHTRILKKVERSAAPQLFLQLDSEPTRLYQMSPERLSDNPFQRPIKLF